MTFLGIVELQLSEAMKFLKEQGNIKVKAPAATVSGLNWTLATQL